MLSDFYFISPSIYTLGYIDDPIVLDNFILDCISSIKDRFAENDTQYSPMIRILLVISFIKPKNIKTSVEVAHAVFASLKKFQTTTNTDPDWLRVLIPCIHHIISCIPAVSSDLELYNSALEWSFSEPVISNLNKDLRQDYMLLIQSIPEASIQEKTRSLSPEMNEKFKTYDLNTKKEINFIKFLLKNLNDIDSHSDDGFFKVTTGFVIKLYELNHGDRIADPSLTVHSAIQNVYPKLQHAFRNNSHPRHRSSLILIFHLSRLTYYMLNVKDRSETSANVIFSLAHLISTYGTDAEVLKLFESVKPRLHEFIECLVAVFIATKVINRYDLLSYTRFFEFLKDGGLLSDNLLKNAKNSLYCSFLITLPISVKSYQSLFLISDIDRDLILNWLLLHYITKYHSDDPIKASKDKVFIAEFYFQLVESKSISLTEKLLLEQTLKQLHIIN